MPEKAKLIAEAEQEFAAFQRALAGLNEVHRDDIFAWRRSRGI